MKKNSLIGQVMVYVRPGSPLYGERLTILKNKGNVNGNCIQYKVKFHNKSINQNYVEGKFLTTKKEFIQMKEKAESRKMNIELTKELVMVLDVFLDRIKEARGLIYSRYLETITGGNQVDIMIYKTLRDLTDYKDVEVVINNIEEQSKQPK